MLRVSLTTVVLFTALSVGCDDRAPTESPVPEKSTPEKSTKDVVRDDLAQWLEFAAQEQVQSASLERELAQPVRDLEALDLRHVPVLRALYGVREHRPAWVDIASGAGLGEAGTALLEELRAAQTKHGLYGEDFHLATIESLAAGARARDAAAFADVRFEAAELRLVQEWAEENTDAVPEDLARVLARRDGPTPRLAELVHARVGGLQTVSKSTVRLDLYLSDALVEYGTQMRWTNPAWFVDVTWPDHLKTPEQETRVARMDRIRDRRELLARRELLPVFDDPSRLPAILATFVPPFEQYARLTKAFEEYAKMVEAGGWPKLPEGVSELKLGDDSEAVAVLKQRLRVEGYWQGDETTRFTDSLVEALKDYQRTHQLWEKGVLSRETRASLDVPADRRLAQIRVALQRWRESNIGPDSHYVFVNIPDFHLEVWKDGARALRFGTVVGSTTRERNPDSGAVEYVHATPEVSSQIQHVVLNPYWWVPRDIAENELEPEIAKNPWYLQENGYEYASDDRGEATLRQKPGPKNALGRVKLNFDNPYQIYMHDTPEQTLFRWPARAFSHGCIRLQQPMELARYLLEADDQWDQATVDGLLAAGQEKWLTLKQPVAVHIEYYVVRVDDLGRANFLSDLYGRDISRMSAATKRGASESTVVNTLD